MALELGNSQNINSFSRCPVAFLAKLRCRPGRRFFVEITGISQSVIYRQLKAREEGRL